MTPSHPNRSTAQNEQVLQLDFRSIYYSIRERAWLVALCFVVAGAAAFAYLKRTPKIFESQVVLQVEQEEQKILNIEQVLSLIHISEPTRLLSISYAVFCLKKK